MIANILITQGQVLYRIAEIISAVIQPLYDQYAKLYDARYYILSRALVRDIHICAYHGATRSAANNDEAQQPEAIFPISNSNT